MHRSGRHRDARVASAASCAGPGHAACVHTAVQLRDVRRACRLKVLIALTNNWNYNDLQTDWKCAPARPSPACRGRRGL